MHNHIAQNADCAMKLKKEVSEPIKMSVPALLFYSVATDSVVTE